MINIKFPLSGLAVLIAGLLFAQTVQANAPKIIAAQFYADWCASCRTMDPVYKEAAKNFADKSVVFVRFDKTDDATSNNSALLASALGIESTYQANQKTGFVLLIDAASKEVVGKLTKAHSEAQIRDAITRVLSGEVIKIEESKGETMKGSSAGSMKGSYN